MLELNGLGNDLVGLQQQADAFRNTWVSKDPVSVRRRRSAQPQDCQHEAFDTEEFDVDWFLQVRNDAMGGRLY